MNRTSAGNARISPDSVKRLLTLREVFERLLGFEEEFANGRKIRARSDLLIDFLERRRVLLRGRLRNMIKKNIGIKVISQKI